MKRKIIGFIMVLCAVMSLAVYVHAAEIVKSGECGYNVVWTLDSEGTLTISGNGNMYENFGNSTDDMPWHDNQDNIKSVVISDNVTSISENAFWYCTNITNVIIGSNVTRIGDSAFYGCWNLTDIFIPSSVASISRNPFCECTNLKKITVDPLNLYYSSENGILFNKEKTELIACPTGMTGSYHIPPTVKSINDYAFYFCKNITDIQLPVGLNNIGNYAFRASSIQDIFIPDTVTNIGSSAFSDCNELTKVSLPTNITTIQENTFAYCSELYSIEIPKHVTTIKDCAFFRSALRYIVLPSSLLTIGKNTFTAASVQDVYYCGSKTEWDKHNLSGDFLDYTAIHYNHCEFPIPTIQNLNCQLSNNEYDKGYLINMDIKNIFYTSEIIAVVYKHNAFSGFASAKVNATCTSANLYIESNAIDSEDIIKVFIWDSLEGMRPLCEAKTKPIE